MMDLQTELDSLEAMRPNIHRLFPAYITHIRFPHYKNMAHGTRVDFPFPITALVGSNGSGKTSVLNALYGAPQRFSAGEFWFSTKVDPIEERQDNPNRFIYGHYSHGFKGIVETRKARIRKTRDGRDDPNYWEPTKEAPGDGMAVPTIPAGKKIKGRSLDRWNPVSRKVLYINFRREFSAFDKYFYFGKAPVIRNPGEAPRARAILSKKDFIRRDAVLLSRVLDTGDTSLIYRGRKLATENRLLCSRELNLVSLILGREYDEARLVRHCLFKGEEGLSIRFKTRYSQYSEAFAGSGEVAVTSCVVQVLAAEMGTLVLLDEPEVSLHPGAQKRLLAFLARTAKEKKLQIVFSTHSPDLISALPDDAIKTFVPVADGSFSVIPETHPYAAFHHLGATNSTYMDVLVEDRLAQSVVRQALRLIEDEELRKVFRVEFVSGGASSMLTYRVPVFMDGKVPMLVVLDGDQRKDDLRHPNTIPVAQDVELDKIISNQIGLIPKLSIDGSTVGGNTKQKIAMQRKYLTWIYENLKYLPLSSPEEIVLKASGNLAPADVGSSQRCKAQLAALARENCGGDVTSEQVDEFGAFLLGKHWSCSDELVQLAEVLKAFVARVRPTAT